MNEADRSRAERLGAARALAAMAPALARLRQGVARVAGHARAMAQTRQAALLAARGAAIAPVALRRAALALRPALRDATPALRRPGPRAALTLVVASRPTPPPWLPQTRPKQPGAAPRGPAPALGRPPGARSDAATAVLRLPVPAAPGRKRATTSLVPLTAARAAAPPPPGVALAATRLPAGAPLIRRIPRLAKPYAAPTASVPAAPAASVLGRRPVAPVESAAAPTPPRHALPAPAAPWAGAVQLDGAQIGRWITDQLTEAASRPPSGLSGLDDRLTPVFAGMVGYG